MLLHNILSGCLLVMLISITLSQQQDDVRVSWTRSNYPNPQTQSYDCGRYSKKSYLCDPNKLLSDDEANQLDLVLQGVQNNTRCPCSTYTCRSSRTGYVIAVALMHHIEEEQDYVDDGTNDVQDVIDHNLFKARLFAYTLESYTWNFGNCDEDIIILYSQQDNALYTMTGEAARGKLRDAHIGEITMRVLHKFGPNKKVFEGLHEMINEYISVLEDNYRLMIMQQPAVAAWSSSAPSHMIGHMNLISIATIFTLFSFSIS